MLLVFMMGFYFTTLFIGLVLLVVDLYGCYLDYQEDKQAERDLDRFYALYGSRLPRQGSRQ